MNASTETLVEAGWRYVEAGDFAAARAMFERAVVAGHHQLDTIRTLAELQMDAGDIDAATELLDYFLDRLGPDLPLVDRVALALAYFETVALGNLAPGQVEAAALCLLEAAAAAGEVGWRLLLQPDRYRAITAAIVSPLGVLARLEHESGAPVASGLPTLVPVHTEELGRRHLDDPDIVRAAERLLHALGSSDVAYRLEQARRALLRGAGASTRRRTANATPAPSLRGLIVVIAGGHPTLRELARRDLTRSGASAVREIPAAWEATRRLREVREQLTNANIVVLLPRLLAHSTSDQVRATAQRLGVPLVVADSASTGAIRRAIERYLPPVRHV